MTAEGLDWAYENLNDEDIDEAMPAIPIKNMLNLKTLVIARNALRAVPDEIAQLTQLTYFDISNNMIRHVSDSLCRLTRLEKLFLNHNTPLVRLPHRMDQLHCLHTLNLDFTSVPKELNRICAREDPVETQACLRRISACFGWSGVHAAMRCLLMSKRFTQENCVASLHKDVLRYIVLPMIWATRKDPLWRAANMKLAQE